MANTVRQVMLGQLLIMYSQGPMDEAFGICQNLTNQMPNAYRLVMCELDQLFQSWELFSGDVTFPVPDPTINPDMAYLLNNGDMWDKGTEYGRNRWLLLEHCITQLSKD